jgi:hypothetical protein
MTEPSKSQQPKTDDLELNRETVVDLTEQEGEAARGGMVGRPRECISCENSCRPSDPLR